MAFSNLLEEYQLSDEDVNKQVSDTHLEELSHTHCEKWRHLPTHLGLDNTLKNDIERKPGDESEKRYDFLTEWKQRKGSDATYKALITALLKISCRNDAEYVFQLLQPLLPKMISKLTIKDAQTTSSGAEAASTSSTNVAGDSDAVTSQPASNPKDEMDPDIKMDLEYILKRNLKQITAKYAAYVDTLRRAVLTKGVSAEDLRSYLLAISASSADQNLTLLADKKEELKQCDSVTDIFNFLTTDYASFLNYDIFQFILKYYGITEDQENLQYTRHLDQFLQQHKISEFINVNPHLKSKKGFKEVNLKLDIETTCRLSKVKEIKSVIAEILDINPSALHIVDIQDGCIIVIFCIPKSLVDVLFTFETVFTTQQKEALRDASILWLNCNGTTFYFKDNPSPRRTEKFNDEIKSDDETSSRSSLEAEAEGISALKSDVMEMHHSHPSYHHATNGQEAERRLRKCGDHCYLIRFSERCHCYVLTVYKKKPHDILKHFQIYFSHSMSKSSYKLLGKTRDFGDLASMLHYYENNRIDFALENIGRPVTEQEYYMKKDNYYSIS